MLMDSETRDVIRAGALHWDNPTQHIGTHPRRMTPNVDTGGPEFPPHHSMETAHGARLMPPQGSRQPMKTRRLAGPGAGLVPGLGDISSDGLGVTGRVCDAASPHGCRHASPEHPGMSGDSDTCATNIEYCPSLDSRRYTTHSARANPCHPDGGVGDPGPAEPEGSALVSLPRLAVRGRAGVRTGCPRRRPDGTRNHMVIGDSDMSALDATGR